MLEAVLSHYPQARHQHLEKIEGGLINETYRVGRRYILQRLHPIFTPEVNLDIAALTEHLRIAEIPVPELLKTKDDRYWVELFGRGAADGVWRMMTQLPGTCYHEVQNERQANALGESLGAFHSGLLGHPYRFHFRRLAPHDTDAHLESLRRALHKHEMHRLHSDVSALAEELFATWEEHGVIPDLPQRIGHGDPKVSNFLFDWTDRVVGIVDLDTMAFITLDVELGDAFRSWCNAAPDEASTSRFDAERFRAAMAGYLESTKVWLTRDERESIPDGIIRVALELSTRFAADALNEGYFGWDENVASSRGEHNLMRSRSQLQLARDVIAQRGDLKV